MLSDEEATYLHSAFPSHQQAIDHILLQCPECRSVNFPGTEQNLVVNRGGKMTRSVASERALLLTSRKSIRSSDARGRLPGCHPPRLQLLLAPAASQGLVLLSRRLLPFLRFSWTSPDEQVRCR